MCGCADLGDAYATVSVILLFAGLLPAPWRHARAVLTGAILTPGVRTVTNVLRLLGLARERRFWRYYRVTSRAVRSPRAASHILRRSLLGTFLPTGPLLFGIDDTIERRRGKGIRAKSLCRDPVRSSPSHVVKANGWRWLSVILVARIPWAGRICAFPVLTARAPSENRGGAPPLLAPRIASAT